VLLLAGGLQALQSMTVVTALPFSLILLISAFGMWRALAIETHRDKALEHLNARHTAVASSAWKKRLAGIVDYPDKESVRDYIRNDVMRAMRHLSYGLAEQGWPATTNYDEELVRAYIEVEVHKPDQL